MKLLYFTVSLGEKKREKKGKAPVLRTILYQPALIAAQLGPLKTICGNKQTRRTNFALSDMEKKKKKSEMRSRTATTEATAQQQLQLRRRATVASSSLLALLAAVFVLFASTANAACPFAGKSGEVGPLRHVCFFWYEERRKRGRGGALELA